MFWCTDKLRSYGAAKSEMGLSARHEQGLRKNNRARIRISRRDDANARCSGSNRPDQPNGSGPLMPPSTTRSTSSAISRSATRSASSETKRSGRGELRRQHEPELPLPDFASQIQVRVTTPAHCEAVKRRFLGVGQILPVGARCKAAPPKGSCLNADIDHRYAPANPLHKGQNAIITI